MEPVLHWIQTGELRALRRHLSYPHASELLLQYAQHALKVRNKAIYLILPHIDVRVIMKAAIRLRPDVAFKVIRDRKFSRDDYSEWIELAAELNRFLFVDLLLRRSDLLWTALKGAIKGNHSALVAHIIAPMAASSILENEDVLRWENATVEAFTNEKTDSFCVLINRMSNEVKEHFFERLLETDNLRLLELLYDAMAEDELQSWAMENAIVNKKDLAQVQLWASKKEWNWAALIEEAVAAESGPEIVEFLRRQIIN